MVYSSRFKLWASYFAFTMILLIAIAQVETRGDENTDDKTGKSDKGWGLASTILSLFVISTLIAAHLHPVYREIIINTRTELVSIVVLLLLSTILVSIVSSPDRGLAVDQDGGVFIANMYYFSWASFINGIIILSSYIESVYGINVRQTLRSKSSSFTFWSALLVSSIIVMGSSADIYNQNCDVEKDKKLQPFCSRSVLAVIIATLSILSSLVIVVMKISLGAAPFLFEVASTGLLFTLYAVEVIYVTGPQGPGSPLGNLYYFSWISFFLTFLVGKACYEDYIEAQIIMEQQHNVPDRTVPTLVNVQDEEDDNEVGDYHQEGRKIPSDVDDV